MKRIISILTIAMLFITSVRADEGMWLPSLISQRIVDMQSKGFKLTAEDIYSINQASIKDAVVLFGGGCSGELISSEGLLLTNHHCGYSQIQSHSSVEHDYLKDGFWAMNRSEELPNEGLTVSFLERMDDVTDEILKGYEEGMTESQRDSIVKINTRRLVKEATAEGNGLEADVESLYYGNTYYIFVYRVYRDIRLVAAPPSSIGKFGGDTDNWMWPRHTGDFSIFRIYADKNNNPADYSEDNVPYTPKKFFKISAEGVNEGDFTMVYGFPGSTTEYIYSEDVRYTAEISNPTKIALRTARLNIQEKYMDSDRAIKIKYSSKNARVANSWKRWQGEMKGLIRLKTVQNKKDFEKRFAEWAKGGKYEYLLPEFERLYAELEPYMYAREYFRESANTIELVKFAKSMKELAELDDNATEDDRIETLKSLKKNSDAFFKDYYLPIDKESFVAVMNAFGRDVPEDFKPDYFKNTLAQYGSVEAWADTLFTNSLFINKETVDAMAIEDYANINDDPALQFAEGFYTWYDNDILPVVRSLKKQINICYRDYMKAQMEFEPEKAFYPDANMTLRVAYGNVMGYSPADGIYYYPSSTLTGIIEKDNPEIFDYDIPQELRDIYAARDFGEWECNGSIPVCFLASNHTSGGNSGSPVINADGNLIGINFDRVWEGTMSDIVYDPAFGRNISLDIRYVLFLIDRLGGAHHLIEEMTIVK